MNRRAKTDRVNEEKTKENGHGERIREGEGKNAGRNCKLEIWIQNIQEDKELIKGKKVSFIQVFLFFFWFFDDLLLFF